MENSKDLTVSEPSSLAQYEPASATAWWTSANSRGSSRMATCRFSIAGRLVKDVIRRARELHLRRLELGVEAEKTSWARHNAELDLEGLHQVGLSDAEELQLPRRCSGPGDTGLHNEDPK